MSDSPEPRLGPEPVSVAGESPHQVPPSVRYARSLLWLQGVIWAAMASFSTIDSVIFITHFHGSWDKAAVMIAWPLAVVVAGTGCALTEILLARRLVRGRARIRKTVIGVEIAMTCWGVLLTGTVSPSGGAPADFFGLATLAGAALSLVAALGLLRRRARQFFATPGSSTSDAKSVGLLTPREPGSACWSFAPAS